MVMISAITRATMRTIFFELSLEREWCEDELCNNRIAVERDMLNDFERNSFQGEKCPSCGK